MKNLLLLGAATFVLASCGGGVKSGAKSYCEDRLEGEGLTAAQIDDTCECTADTVADAAKEDDTFGDVVGDALKAYADDPDSLNNREVGALSTVDAMIKDCAPAN